MGRVQFVPLCNVQAGMVVARNVYRRDACGQID